jgi:hypothetical protein
MLKAQVTVFFGAAGYGTELELLFNSSTPNHRTAPKPGK